MRFLMASTVTPKAFAASYTETLLPEERPVHCRVLLDKGISCSCTPPDSRPVLSCTASSIAEYHIDDLPSVIGRVHRYTTYGGLHSFHTVGSGLNLVQPSRLNIVHLVIVRTCCRVL